MLFFSSSSSKLLLSLPLSLFLFACGASTSEADLGQSSGSTLPSDLPTETTPESPEAEGPQSPPSDEPGTPRLDAPLTPALENPETPEPDEPAEDTPDFLLRVEAENYSSYSDTDGINQGGSYRQDGVDIAPTADYPGFYVGWIAAEERLGFDNIVIPTSGNYQVRARVASMDSDREFGVSIDNGQTFIAQGTVPNTGGWEAFQTITLDTYLEAGSLAFDFVAVDPSWNIDWFEIVPGGSGQSPVTAGSDCFQPDEDGVIVIEAESVPANGWSLETQFEGHQGSGYYCDRSGSVDNELVFKFVVPTTGDYRLSVRNYQDGETHESNDAWSEMNDFGQIKLFTHAVYSCGGGSLEDCGFNWNTGLDDHYGASTNLMPADHPNDEIPEGDFFHLIKPAGYQLEAGEHTLRLRGRSAGYCVDRLHIYPDTMLTADNAATARDLSKPESAIGRCSAPERPVSENPEPPQADVPTTPAPEEPVDDAPVTPIPEEPVDDTPVTPVPEDPTADEPVTPSPEEPVATSDPSQVSKWRLVWNDEFNGESISSANWELETNCWGGGNGEQQCYTDRADNAYVSDGHLSIVAQRENFEGSNSSDGEGGNLVTLPYTSARLRTRYKHEWTYGRFEIRARMPYGQGTWPAIWMLPTDSPYGGWASGGEIDIMEAVNLKVDGENRIHGTLHYGRAWPQNEHSGTDYRLPGNANPADGFHTYAIEWEEGEIRWYVNGVHYATQRQNGWYSQYAANGELVNAPLGAPFDSAQQFHMILNLAVGGAWASNVNQRGIDESVFPQQMLVDWVRVFECTTDPATGQGCASVDADADLITGHTAPSLGN